MSKWQNSLGLNGQSDINILLALIASNHRNLCVKWDVEKFWGFKVAEWDQWVGWFLRSIIAKIAPISIIKK